MPGLSSLLVAELREPEHAAGEVRRAVDEVLSRPEFQRPSPGWLQRLRSEVLDFVERILGALLSGGRGTALAYIVLVVAVVATVFIALRFARGVTRDPGRAAPKAQVRRRSAREWLAEAEDAEGAGRWRLGLRCRYRALVAELAERGVVEEVAGRTAGEYRADVAAGVPNVAADFDGATDLFERAWYGDAPVGQPESASFRSLADRVLTGAGR